MCCVEGKKLKVKRKIGYGWVKEKRSLEIPGYLAEDPLKIPGKIFYFSVGHPINTLIIFVQASFSAIYFRNINTCLALR